MATENIKTETGVDIHIGGDNAESDIKGLYGSMLAATTLFACSCIAYLVKSYVAKARNK